MTSLIRSSAVALLFGAAALAGCKNNGTSGTSGGTTDAASNPLSYQFQMGDAITDSTLVAIVTKGGKSDTLTTQEFQEQLMPIIQQNPMAMGDSVQFAQMRRQIVEAFIMRPLVEDAVEADTSLVLDTAAVSARINELKAQMGGEEGLQKQLADAGLTLDSVRTMLGVQQRQSALFDRWAKEAKKPTASELETYRKKMAEEVRVQHIIFDTRTAAGPRLDSVKRVAELVLDSAKKPGADFAALARRHSADGTAATGGVLDFFSRSGPLDYDFKKAAFALRDSGDVSSELVKSAFGYHIIRMNHRREGALPDTATVRQQMMGKRGQFVIVQKLRDLLKAQGVVVRVNEKIVNVDLNNPTFQDEEAI